MEICIKSYNSDESIKNIITVDYLVIGGKTKTFHGLFPWVTRK